MASRRYPGVIVTDDIKGNGRKKMLIIGKTGTGKSSLCNVIAGYPHDAEIFPVSAAAVSCTQSTKFADIFFNQNKERTCSLIDTIGFDDPNNDVDANIISELVLRLKNDCDHVNLFIIAVNGQNPRLDASLIGMIRIFEGMFGEKFWNQVVLVFTRLPMDSKSIKKREKNNKKSDDDLASEYLEILQRKFPKGRGMKHLLMDACYDEDDDDEKTAFETALESLWLLLTQSSPLPTTEVKKVESESKKLQNQIKEKEEMLEMVKQKR